MTPTLRSEERVGQENLLDQVLETKLAASQGGVLSVL